MKKILALVMALVGLATRWLDWRRDPDRIERKDDDENAKAVADGTDDDVNRRLDDKLR